MMSKEKLTPKEKAASLVDKFGSNLSESLYDWARKEYSKKCAIVAVDEIIKSLEDTGIVNGVYYWIKYYQEVKEEIELIN